MKFGKLMTKITFASKDEKIKDTIQDALNMLIEEKLLSYETVSKKTDDGVVEFNAWRCPRMPRVILDGSRAFSLLDKEHLSQVFNKNGVRAYAVIKTSKEGETRDAGFLITVKQRCYMVNW